MFILSSCASAPSQLYRPANYNGSPWNISGEMNHFTNRITIKINNNVVIDGTLSFLSGDGEFFGYYEGKQVTASCMTSMGSFSKKTNCMGVYKKQPKKISRLRISDIEKLMFYYRQKYITVFYGFIRCNKVVLLPKNWHSL